MAVSTSYGRHDSNGQTLLPYSATTSGPTALAEYGLLSKPSGSFVKYEVTTAGGVSAEYGPIQSRPQVPQYRARLESTPISLDLIRAFGSARRGKC